MFIAFFIQGPKGPRGQCATCHVAAPPFGARPHMGLERAGPRMRLEGTPREPTSWVERGREDPARCGGALECERASARAHWCARTLTAGDSRRTGTARRRGRAGERGPPRRGSTAAGAAGRTGGRAKCGWAECARASGTCAAGTRATRRDGAKEARERAGAPGARGREQAVRAAEGDGHRRAGCGRVRVRISLLALRSRGGQQAMANPGADRALLPEAGGLR